MLAVFRASPRKERLESTNASGSFTDSPKQLRVGEAPWGAASHSKTPSGVLVNSRCLQNLCVKRDCHCSKAAVSAQKTVEPCAERHAGAGRPAWSESL